MGKRKDDEFWISPCERPDCPMTGWHAHEEDLDIPAEVLDSIRAEGEDEPDVSQ